MAFSSSDVFKSRGITSSAISPKATKAADRLSIQTTKVDTIIIATSSAAAAEVADNVAIRAAHASWASRHADCSVR